MAKVRRLPLALLSINSSSQQQLSTAAHLSLTSTVLTPPPSRLLQYNRHSKIEEDMIP